MIPKKHIMHDSRDLQTIDFHDVLRPFFICYNVVSCCLSVSCSLLNSLLVSHRNHQHVCLIRNPNSNSNRSPSHRNRTAPHPDSHLPTTKSTYTPTTHPINHHQNPRNVLPHPRPKHAHIPISARTPQHGIHALSTKSTSTKSSAPRPVLTIPCATQSCPNTVTVIPFGYHQGPLNIKVSCTECYVPVVMSELERKSEEQVVEEWLEDMGEGAGGYGEIW
jgi:hypothetical protein